MKPLLDPDHPFFAPVWRRWATAMIPLGWGIVELVFSSPAWGMLFIAAGAYACWALIIKGPTKS